MSGAATGRPNSSQRPLRIALAVLLALGVVAVGWISVRSWSADERSAFTQRHGVSRRATVVRVIKQDHATKSSSWNTWDYDVALAEAVGGRVTSTVRDPSLIQDFRVGDRLTALVDPHEPTYAELPGSPYSHTRWYLLPASLACAVLVVVAVLAGRRVQARRRND